MSKESPTTPDAVKAKLIPIFQFIGYCEEAARTRPPCSPSPEWFKRLGEHAENAEKILKEIIHG